MDQAAFACGQRVNGRLPESCTVDDPLVEIFVRASNLICVKYTTNFDFVSRATPDLIENSVLD
jgi:hypothetical protein